MNSMVNSMIYESSYYASNDSGLSSTSNSGGDGDHRSFTTTENYHSDDLTKSLFINSFRGSELIQDDDIYSYKSKIESKNNNFNRILSFSLSKTDNIKTRSPDSLSNIFHDLAKIDKASSEISNLVPQNKQNANDNSDKMATSTNFEDLIFDNKFDLDNMKQKKSTKKLRSSTATEYVSSSIKNYRGDKDINDLVDFIQGKSNKSIIEANKADKLQISIKIESNNLTHNKSDQICLTSDSGIFSDQNSPIFNLNSGNVNANPPFTSADNSQSSHFVSLDNSEEDVAIVQQITEFQEVVSKTKKKQQKSAPTPDHVITKDKTHLRSTNHNSIKKLNNNQGLTRHNLSKSASKNHQKNQNDLKILNSKDNIQKFLYAQFSLFVKRHGIMVDY